MTLERVINNAYVSYINVYIVAVRKYKHAGIYFIYGFTLRVVISRVVLSSNMHLYEIEIYLVNLVWSEGIDLHLEFLTINNYYDMHNGEVDS